MGTGEPRRELLHSAQLPVRMRRDRRRADHALLAASHFGRDAHQELLRHRQLLRHLLEPERRLSDDGGRRLHAVGRRLRRPVRLGQHAAVRRAEQRVVPRGWGDRRAYARRGTQRVHVICFQWKRLAIQRAVHPSCGSVPIRQRGADHQKLRHGRNNQGDTLQPRPEEPVRSVRAGPRHRGRRLRLQRRNALRALQPGLERRGQRLVQPARPFRRRRGVHRHRHHHLQHLSAAHLFGIRQVDLERTRGGPLGERNLRHHRHGA